MCLGKQVCLTHHPCNMLQPFQELNCRTLYIMLQSALIELQELVTDNINSTIVLIEWVTKINGHIATKRAQLCFAGPSI
jgi:hypothetical protein